MTKKVSPKELKKMLHEFIDDLAEGSNPEAEQMADELKRHGDEFIHALSGEGGAQFRNNGEGFRNGGGYSHSSFRGNSGGGGGGGSQMRGGEFRDEAQMRGGSQMRDEVDWDEKEKKRQEENRRKMDELESELKRLKMRMRDEY